MTLTEEQIAEIRARAEAATPGPWKWWTSNSWNRLKSDDRGVTQNVAEPFVNQYDRHPDLSINEADMDFIAHARTDIPALLSALEAQAAELAEVRQQYVDANEARIDAEAALAEARKALGLMLREHDILSGNFGDVMDPKHRRPDRWPTAAEAARRACEGGETNE